MKVEVTARVRQRAVETFAAADARDVCAALADADLPLISNNGERVHLAILQLARGDPARFREQLKLAQTDWRDVLVAASLTRAE